MKKDLNFLIIFIGIAIIMLPLSFIIEGQMHILGVHEGGDIHIFKSYKLDVIEKIGKNRYGNLGRIFSSEDEIYRIEIVKRDARYQFFASLKESPEQHLGKVINLKFNYIYNIFGGSISVRDVSGLDPLPENIGTPVYGEIIKGDI
ncbi:MAG: hypothetical protein HYW34_04065 [Candidatus Brennerbacteria bacterium]|nr:hypothetical protein [Candidatus Brennerbacteria bacterium]